MSDAKIDPVELTVEGAQAAFASGATTSEALTQAFLDRIAEYNPLHNAIIFLNPESGVLSFAPNLPQFAACLADPARPPDLSEPIAAKEAYLDIFDAVFAEARLDALAFPQMRTALPPLHGAGTIHETTVGEINIAGLPGVTVPAGYYESGAPFNLIFVGRMWSEADLLAYPTLMSTRRGTAGCRRSPRVEQNRGNPAGAVALTPPSRAPGRPGRGAAEKDHPCPTL